MSPNVMSGCEWIHSIASAVVNHNAAAAPPMSEDGHCTDGCREYTCSCVGSKNTKILYLIIFSSRLSFRLSWTWIPKYGLCALSIAVNSEIQASLRKKALHRCVGFTRVTHMNRICCKCVTTVLHYLIIAICSCALSYTFFCLSLSVTVWSPFKQDDVHVDFLNVFICLCWRTYWTLFLAQEPLENRVMFPCAWPENTVLVKLKETHISI